MADVEFAQQGKGFNIAFSYLRIWQFGSGLKDRRLFEELHAWFALNAAALHRVPQVLPSEERRRGLHVVEMMDDEDVVRVIDHLVY
ncbi:hypothetical protein [Arthrobacter sp. SLBN-122]|uniref:hypothetical protein n=1 Tax=Arthrobacter sp. SLBN-122 TaxID=2768455 RepID=UPI001151E4AB|nr:hypothetical protein [Arthrobacter sp. SLBN-122]